MSPYLKGFIFFLLAGVFGCQGETVQRSFQSDPVAFGKINQLNVIADTSLWQSPMGDSILFYYMAAYPILPQPEPIFDVRHLSPDDLKKDPYRRQLRNYLVVADLSDPTSATAEMVRNDIGEEKLQQNLAETGYATTVGKDKWARGQLIVYIYGNDKEKLLENLTSSYPAVAQRIHQADENIIEATAYFSGENRGLSEEIKEKMKVDMRIPEEFMAAISEEEIMWLRRETSEASSNILLRRLPYTSQEQLTYEGIKAIRDSIGRQYISSTLPGTYMRINDQDLPMFVDITRLNGDYAVEARGIWDIVNDYMGGAFVSYLVYDPNKSDLLFMDAFIHAPGKNKRDLMQELEYVLHTAQY